MLGLLATQQSVAADIVVYKSPTCGCCGKWVKHMEDAGFSVDVENQGRPDADQSRGLERTRSDAVLSHGQGWRLHRRRARAS